MDQKIKKHIRLLAERSGHNIDYQAESILIRSFLNEVTILQSDKYSFDFQYNTMQGSIKVRAAREDVYDLLLGLLGRIEAVEVKRKTGPLLTMEEWIKEEGKLAKTELEQLRADLQSQEIHQRRFGGNRIEAEYYDGLIILSDDLCWWRSNVIEI